MSDASDLQPTMFVYFYYIILVNVYSISLNVRNMQRRYVVLVYPSKSSERRAKQVGYLSSSKHQEMPFKNTGDFLSHSLSAKHKIVQ